MKSTKILSLMLVVVMCLGMLASCFKKDCVHVDANDDFKCDSCGVAFDDGYPKTYTYNTYLTLSPSNWNELSYQDNNDTNVLSYISSSFFTFDFKYDENGEILPGEFDVEFDAATALEDVSAEYAEAWGIPEGAKNRAWKITLRDDLKWQNGDPITAEDFVYTMQEQLNPLFRHYRADSYYTGSTIIVNAQGYVKQGMSDWFAADTIYDLSEYSSELDSLIKWKMGPSTDDSASISYVRKYFESNVGMPKDYSVEQTASYLTRGYLGVPNPGAEYDPESGMTEEEYNAAKATYDHWVGVVANMEGKTYAEIKADADMKAVYDAILGWWKTEPGEELHLGLAHYTYPAVDWADVGIFAPSKYEIVIVLEKGLDLLKSDGTLSYKAAYNMASLPLVHKATYEKCKQEPATEGALWTSNYNSSVATTMSWGPYKLESFQSGAQYTLVKNDNWYGFNMEANEGLYQTEKIVFDIVKDWNSAWIKFQAGEIDGIGIDVSIADDYKNSEQAFFTPDDYVGSLQLQSSAESLKTRGEKEGVNKMLLAYTDFRKALSLSIDRADYAAKCTTASLKGFGLFNSMHYYDVANGGVFRNTDEAKQVLCDVYGVDVSKYDSLDAAYESITGYNLDLARELVVKAYNAAVEAGDIDADDIVKFTFGSGAINEAVQRHFDYITGAWTKLVEGTPLAGRLQFELADKGTNWSKDFRAGGYDICMGGWSGAAWDPGYFLLAYLDPGYMYSAAWPTSDILMTFKMKGVAEDGGDIEETMSLLDWYACLNGSTGAKYDWSSAALEESKRLQLIAALEKEILSVYYTVPTYNSFGASLISFQIDYVTYEYNTFMGYGGLKYMTYNFCDVEWNAEVAKQGGQLNYK